MITSAKAGLNLNVFGALAGAFSSKSSKETAEDGSSLETEEKNARVKGKIFRSRWWNAPIANPGVGAGAGNLNAAAAANAEKNNKSRRQIDD